MNLKYFLKIINICIFVILIMVLASCNNKDVQYIRLDNNEAFLDNKKISEYNYVWHIDSNGNYDEVKDSSAEYYTGDKPNEEDGIWIAHDIKYFPIIDKNKFYKNDVNENKEWCTNYENEKYKEMTFACLPRGNNDEFPDYMMHTAEEAYNNPCLHITLPGTYELSGIWNGQIFVDLGKDSKLDSSKKINLILNNVELNCTVASGINIYRAYECDNKWKDRNEQLKDIDLKDAGVNILIKDNTKNYIKGANVFRILKSAIKKKKEGQKIIVKDDGAITSTVSLNINSEKKNNGELYINSTLEGISSDLHIGINGGKIYINADNDGINCNNDNVSILKINNGELMINAGLGYEGDGIDSNGYIVINGGKIVTVANYEMDPGIDSVNGVEINGGSLVALGETESIDWAKIYMGENTNQSYVFKSFDDVVSKDAKIVIIDEKGNEVYEFSEKNIPFINDRKRDFRGILISNSNIKKDMKYDIVIK